VIGELGLTGEVRRVGRLEARLEEARRRGFTRAIVPRGAAAMRTPGLEVVEVRDLKAAIEAAELSVLRVESG
jgi:DNA repair protein RadA/Sms